MGFIVSTMEELNEEAWKESFRAHDNRFIEFEYTFHASKTLEEAISIFLTLPHDMTLYPMPEMLFLKFCSLVVKPDDLVNASDAFTRRFGTIVVLPDCCNVLKKLVLLGDAIDNDFYRTQFVNGYDYDIDESNLLLQFGKRLFPKAVDCDTRIIAERYKKVTSDMVMQRVFPYYNQRFMKLKRSSGIAGFQYEMINPKHRRANDGNVRLGCVGKINVKDTASLGEVQYKTFKPIPANPSFGELNENAFIGFKRRSCYVNKDIKISKCARYF